MGRGERNRLVLHRYRVTLREQLSGDPQRQAVREPKDGDIFYTAVEARVLVKRQREYYNRVRPHDALGYRPQAPDTIAAGPPSASHRSVQQQLSMETATA